jgi:N-methylhydantoinase B/oxoprolinase/acetone carboxylase alpha subunit
MGKELDPIQYEIFRHRLFNILEEGRIALSMVSGSPVVVGGNHVLLL